jgi:hypothetical protein
MAYATLNELKAFVAIPVSDTVDDTALQLALDAASTQVEGFCDRLFTADSVATTRWYTVTDTGHVDVDPISTTTGLVVATDDNGDGVAETSWTLNTDYRLEPINAALSSPVEPWTRLVVLGTRWFPRLQYRPGVSVTAKFGWPGGTAPQAVKLATLIQASRLFKRKDAPFGVAGSVEFGSEMRLLNELDRDAQNLLRPFRRNWWVA